jgi:hypothetical protein
LNDALTTYEHRRASFLRPSTGREDQREGKPE